jgi:uncharacterized membrane protein YfcA
VIGPADLATLLGVGVLAGIVSTVAGLASVVSYPALLALGLPPVSANVTNTVALMFTGLGATLGSRPELAGQGRLVARLGVLAVAGGAAGAALLLLTPAAGFEHAAPVLIALGSVAILRPPGRSAAGSAPAAAPETALETGPGPDSPRDTHALAIRGGWWSRAGVFAVAVYSGYFGAAGGILMLALLLRMLGTSLARTNAVKNAIGGLSNGVAGLGFAIFGPVRWAAVVPLALGFLVGGWTGPKIVRRLPATGLRVLISLGGLALAIKLGLSAYA